MLLIGDIHITSRFKDKIISWIKNFVEQNPDEKNIIFLWDYVYHFSYDRNSILELYNLFLDLFKEWKNIYILAWNHDRLWNNFVFEEAQKAFDIINKIKESNESKIHFITDPIIEKIENKDMLFLPFTINSKEIEYSNPLFQELANSTNKNEKFSWYINQILENYIKENNNLTIIHHYYINNTVFPWQRSRFSYKDICLSDSFLENPEIKLISWHLHQSFIYKNYLCCWSLWSTTPLELNQNKFLFNYSPSKETISWYFNDINPYISIERSQWETINEDNLQKHFENITKNNIENLKSNQYRNFEIKNTANFKIENLSIQIKSDDISYQDIQDYVDQKVLKECKDIKIKKNSKSIHEIIQNFSTSAENLKTGFNDRKIILKEYIENKFWTDSEKYKKVLKELDII